MYIGKTVQGFPKFIYTYFRELAVLVAVRETIFDLCSGVVFENSLLHRELVQVCVEDRHDLELRLHASIGVTRHDDGWSKR